MTCYMRHMDWLLDALDLAHESGDKHRLDAALHTVLGLDAGAHCPEVWAAYKALSDDERVALVPPLREALGI